MKCPECERDTKGLVTETRKGDDGLVYRRRYCGRCGAYFVTREVAEPGLKMPPQNKKESRATGR